MKHVAECPTCLNEFPTTVAAAQEGLRCPKCDTGFVPDSLKEYPEVPLPLPPAPRLPDPKPAKRSETTHQNTLKNLSAQAEAAGSKSVLCAGIGAVCFGLALIMLLFGSSYWSALASMAGSFFLLSCWFTLLKHLLYIRLALEKSA